MENEVEVSLLDVNIEDNLEEPVIGEETEGVLVWVDKFGMAKPSEDVKEAVSDESGALILSEIEVDEAEVGCINADEDIVVKKVENVVSDSPEGSVTLFDVLLENFEDRLAGYED